MTRLPIKTQYDPVAKTLHWLIALAIFGMLALGWYMTGVTGPEKFGLFQWHKSIGITILLLVVLRLLWRWTHRPPVFPSTMSPLEQRAAYAGHALLYLLIIAMPLAGWVMVSTSPINIPTLLYGVIPWPHIPVLPDLPNKKEIGHVANKTHEWLAWVILTVVAGHILIAWKHHLMNRDDILVRMAPKFLMGFLNRIRGKK